MDYIDGILMLVKGGGALLSITGLVTFIFLYGRGLSEHGGSEKECNVGKAMMVIGVVLFIIGAAFQ